MGEHLLQFRLLFSILLLSALICKNIGYASSKATLPKEEADAITAIIRSIPQRRRFSINYTELSVPTFSTTDCGVQFNDSVICDCTFNNGATCRVTTLDFSNIGMRGQIPKEIGYLTSLNYLDLSGNKLRKWIPTSFEKLTNLSTLYLYDNLLEGPIPTVFGQMKSLKDLDLGHNKLGKEIPSSFQKLTNLSTLILDDNLLEGPIPTFFGQMKSLEFLSLSDNNFVGAIPELGGLPSLLYLYLDGNLLSGRVPNQLGSLFSLVLLDLSDNQLSGDLPHELGNLTTLEIVELANNNFSGNLQSFEKLKNISYFDVRGNNFNGQVPNFTANWKYLRLMCLMGNNFEWPSDHGVFQSLPNLRSLKLADITEGPGGKIDFTSLKLNGTLTYLTLRNCSLHGPIPEFIWQNTNLEYLDLSFNNLTGAIPTFASIYLREVYLRGNMLSKSSPGWFTNLTDSSLDISENNFTSLSLPLPPSNITKKWNLFSCCSNTKNWNEAWQKRNYYCHNGNTTYEHLYINCGGNLINLNGNDYEADLEDSGRSTFFLSPSKSWGYSSMGSWAYWSPPREQYIINSAMDFNFSDGYLYTTARIAPISLKYYGFCLKSGDYTVKLHFAEIPWQGRKWPPIVNGRQGMRIFNVKIQDTKEITNFNITEAESGNKSTTKEFNVFVNNTRLEIHLYWTGKGLAGYRFPYYGPLISAISVSPVPKVNTTEHGRKFSALTIAGIVACALVIPALLFVLLRELGWFGSKGLHDEELKGIELLPGAFFNFQQIKAATQNFSSANKLGQGGFGPVYKGALPNGTTIAVKQLSAKSNQGIREFVNEVGTISALQHPNLVKLLGCCAEDNQLLLVYEYMENNSLAHVLFGLGELRSRLNWPTRIKVCLGIAKGLAFLHEESKLKIVHRDIKPTNILLDRDFNAKISDFGFAKLYEEEMTHVSTRIAGTIGYMAPEYAMRGHLTNKADVYSFGVVTLEIVSGKNSNSYRPNDENVFLLDLAYVLQEKGNLIELVDPTLGSDYSLVQAIAILELAMLCTNPSPSLRPAMSEVVNILEGKSKIAATPVSAPYSMDDSAIAKDMSGFSQSTQIGSTSQEGTSNANSSQAVSKEVEKSDTFFDCSAEIKQIDGSSAKEISSLCF